MSLGITKDQYVELAKLLPADYNQYDHFGWSVSLSGGGRPWTEPVAPAYSSPKLRIASELLAFHVFVEHSV